MINFLEGLFIGILLYIAGAPPWVAVLVAYIIPVTLNYIEHQSRKR